MRRLRKLQDRVRQLEKEMAAFKAMRVRIDIPLMTVLIPDNKTKQIRPGAYEGHLVFNESGATLILTGSP
jgi:hypothetical protein